MIEIKLKRFFQCPNGCDHDFEVEHIFAFAQGRSAGPWYCDECGDSWNVERTQDGLDVTRSNRPRQVKRHVVLELPPQTSPVRFRITRGFDPGYISLGSTEFLYESHSCPTNWLGDIDVMEFEGRQDPHGLIRFVNEFDATPESTDTTHDVQSLMGVPDVSTGKNR